MLNLITWTIVCHVLRNAWNWQLNYAFKKYIKVNLLHKSNKFSSKFQCIRSKIPNHIRGVQSPTTRDLSIMARKLYITTCLFVNNELHSVKYDLRFCPQRPVYFEFVELKLYTMSLFITNYTWSSMDYNVLQSVQNDLPFVHNDL